MKKLVSLLLTTVLVFYSSTGAFTTQIDINSDYVTDSDIQAIVMNFIS